MNLSRNRWIMAAGVTGAAVAVAVTGAVAANAAQEPASASSSRDAGTPPERKSTADKPPAATSPVIELQAFDASGAKLVTGHNGVGVGKGVSRGS